MKKPINVDEFIANAIAEAQPILEELRKMIKSSFPDIEEKIGYGVPQYKYKNLTLGMSVASKHVTLGFDYDAISYKTREHLEEKGYKMGLQTMQIKIGKDFPREDMQNVFNEIMQNSK